MTLSQIQLIASCFASLEFNTDTERGITLKNIYITRTSVAPRCHLVLVWILVNFITVTDRQNIISSVTHRQYIYLLYV